MHDHAGHSRKGILDANILEGRISLLPFGLGKNIRISTVVPGNWRFCEAVTYKYLLQAKGGLREWEN
jgi:hypothetical protein